VILVEEFFFPKSANAPVLAPCTFTQKIPRKYDSLEEFVPVYPVDSCEL
jgi:hypothetical protein